MKLTTLYIATHNQTGLKYFGKTTKYYTEQDMLDNYIGSGRYWKRHLKKHGKDVSIEIYGIYGDEVEEIALKFSKDNNIVESNEWANLMPENGLDGGHTSEMALKAKRTKSTIIWKSTTGKIMRDKIKNTRNNQKWKSTIGKIMRDNMKKTKSNKKWKEITGVNMGLKVSKTKSNIEWKKTVGKQQATKRLETFSEEDWVKMGNNISKTKSTKEWKKTVGKQQGIKYSKTMLLKSKFYNLYNALSGELQVKCIPFKELKKYNQYLRLKSKDNYLGKSIKAKNQLIKYNKEEYIGLYPIECLNPYIQ